MGQVWSYFQMPKQKGSGVTAARMQVSKCISNVLYSHDQTVIDFNQPSAANSSPPIQNFSRRSAWRHGDKVEAARGFIEA